MQTAADVLSFWFIEHGPSDWFAGAPDFDGELAARFAETHASIARGEGFPWRISPESRLAEILVLDQFSRQLFRGDARAFAQDGMALVLAEEVVAAGLDQHLPAEKRQFVYMPYMHAESLIVHDEAMRLFAAMPGENWLKYEIPHRLVIARFGRFPKRNVALGRRSTPEELIYLAESGDSAF